MTAIWFYHLQSQPLERALPALVEKAIARDWRVVIQTREEAGLAVLDDLLWRYSAESFLPHGRADEPHAARHPVVLTCAADNPNGAVLRFYVHGAEIAAVEAGYNRLILLFDGGVEDELAAARRQWSRLKQGGHDLAYWQQSESGWSQVN